MIKTNRRYVSFLQHLVHNDYSFAIWINDTFYPKQKLEFNKALLQDQEDRYHRYFAKKDDRKTGLSDNSMLLVEDLNVARRRLIGGLQPLADMQKDFVNTFRLYKSWGHILTDGLQPVRGIGNILRSLLIFTGAFIYVPLAKLGVISESQSTRMRTNFAASWFLDSFSSLIRGVTQIAFTPLMPVKILFRSIATSIMGWQKIENDIGINRLVSEAAKADEKLQSNGNTLDSIVNELERKVKKAQALNRPEPLENPDRNNRPAIVVRTILFSQALRQENIEHIEKIGALARTQLMSSNNNGIEGDLLANVLAVSFKNKLSSVAYEALRKDPTFYQKPV